MTKESFVLLIDLYLDIQAGVRETLDFLVGGCVSMVGYNEGFLGKLTTIEKVFKYECHPSFLECGDDDCPYYSTVLDDTELSSEKKADILMNPRNGRAY